MGGGFSFPFPDMKFPDLGKKVSNFGKGVGSALTGNKQVKVQVRTGPFGLGRPTTQMRSVSSTPRSFSGFSGEFLVNFARKHGRTEQKSIVSNSKKPSVSSSNKPSLIERIKPNKKSNNIGNIEMSNMSQLKQQAGNKKKPSKKETTPSKKEKNPPKKETTPSKKEKKASENKMKPSENKKKPSKK